MPSDRLLTLRKVLREVAMIHPPPWKEDQDWTLEVVASDGHTVARGLTGPEAAEILDAVRGD